MVSKEKFNEELFIFLDSFFFAPIELEVLPYLCAMKKEKLAIGIIGAGIAGLTVGIMLQRMGHSIRIFEATPSIRGIGAGLGLAANAMKAFDLLDLGEEVREISQPLAEFKISDPRGNVFIQIDTERIAHNFGTGNFSVHRADLHAILNQKIPLDRLLTNRKLVDLQQNPDRVTALFEDGSKMEFDYLIGADGVNSGVRQALWTHTTPKYAGYWCWRGTVQLQPDQHIKGGAFWGAKGRFGITPLINNRIYWFACVNSKIDGEAKDFGLAELKDNFQSYPPQVLELLRLTTEEKLITGPIVDIDPLNRFYADRVLLIGDAAHATTPNMGQGAGMAIEDVAVLQDELQKGSAMDRAFQNFEKRRLDRTRYIIKNSRKAGKIAQSDSLVLNRIRNVLFRALPVSWTQFPLKRLYEEDFMKL